MDIKDIEIMEFEHKEGQHTSDDWASLQDRCYECFKIVKEMKELPLTSSREEIHERNQEVLGRLDYHIMRNPLDR